MCGGMPQQPHPQLGGGSTQVVGCRAPLLSGGAAPQGRQHSTTGIEVVVAGSSELGFESLVAQVVMVHIPASM